MVGISNLGSWNGRWSQVIALLDDYMKMQFGLVFRFHIHESPMIHDGASHLFMVSSHYGFLNLSHDSAFITKGIVDWWLSHPKNMSQLGLFFPLYGKTKKCSKSSTSWCIFNGSCYNPTQTSTYTPGVATAWLTPLRHLSHQGSPLRASFLMVKNGNFRIRQRPYVNLCGPYIWIYVGISMNGGTPKMDGL